MGKSENQNTQRKKKGAENDQLESEVAGDDEALPDSPNKSHARTGGGLTLQPLAADHPIFSAGTFVCSVQGLDLEKIRAARKRSKVIARFGSDASTQKRSVKAHLDKAQRLLDREQFAEALPLFREVFDLLPDDKSALFGAGVCCCLTGEWGDGLVYLERAKTEGHEKAAEMLIFARRELSVPPAIRPLVHEVQSTGLPLIPIDLAGELRIIRDHGPLTEKEATRLTPLGLAEYMIVVREALYAVGEEEFVRLREKLRERILFHIFRHHQNEPGTEQS